jgi:hypothetical protein
MAFNLFAPPTIFLLFFALIFLGSKGLARYSLQGSKGGNKTESYACGQRNIENYINPDYSEFFPFAFFFTIMHVLVLVVATAPRDALLLPVLFIISGILSMVIIFRR